MNNMLTICIPTYNRPAELYEALCAFLPQVSKYSIEICVSDNSENEETERVVKAYALNYPYIRYHRNSHNVGFDRNICEAAAMAHSDYIWLFGDDDFPLPGAVENVYRQLTHEPALVLLNSGRSEIEDKKRIKINHVSGINGDIWYKEPEQFFMDLVWHSVFISVLVVKKKLWDSVNASRYYDTGLVHVGIIFESLPQSRAGILFLADPHVAQGWDRSSWTANYMDVLLRKWPKIISLLPVSYSQSAKEIALLSHTCQFMKLRKLFQLRADGYLNLGTFRKLVLPFWIERTHRYGCAGRILLMAAILLFIPPIFLQFSRCTYRFLKPLNQ